MAGAVLTETRAFRASATAPAASHSARAGGAPNAARRFLIFRLSGNDYAIGLEDVREIVPMARLSRPPGLPPIAEGFLNLGGRAVCVLRLDRLLNLKASEPGLYSAIVILQEQGTIWAWLVDEALEIIAAPENFLPVSAEQSFMGCAVAEIPARGRTIHLLSPERIVMEQERQTLGHFQALEQQRLAGLQGVAP